MGTLHRIPTVSHSLCLEWPIPSFFFLGVGIRTGPTHFSIFPQWVTAEHPLQLHRDCVRVCVCAWEGGLSRFLFVFFSEWFRRGASMRGGSSGRGRLPESIMGFYGIFNSRKDKVLCVCVGMQACTKISFANSPVIFSGTNPTELFLILLRKFCTNKNCLQFV